ncbi:hypothetical protein D3C79_791970 [compost metagenome]
MHLEPGIEHGDRCRHIVENFPEVGLACAQRPLGIAHPHQGPQGGDQYIRVHRVHQVGVGTGIEPGNDVAGLDRRRRHVDHRQQGGLRVGTEQPDNIEAAHVGQVDIQDQPIDLLTVDQCQPLATGARFEDLIAMQRQAPTQRIPGGCVVVDDEQANVRVHQRPPEPKPAE